MKSFLKTLPAALCCALLIFMTGPSPAAASPATDPIVDELRGDLDLGYFDRYWGELEEEARRYMPELSPEGLMERVRSGERLFDPAELFSGIGRFFFGEVLLNFKLMGQLLLLAVAASFLKNLESAFERRQVATLTRSIVFLVLLGICLFSFKAVLQLAGKTIDNMVDFSLASLPALTALLAAQGSVVSSALFHPLIVFGINFFGTFISRVIFPLIFFSAVLGLVDHFSPHFKVSRLSDLFKELSTWALGISMTVFVGILTVQGAAGTVADAVSLRTAKYMTGALSPWWGKFSPMLWRRWPGLRLS